MRWWLRDAPPEAKPRRWRYVGLVAVFAVLSVVAGAACGETDLDELVEGETFEMGELRYNVLFTRTLNPSDIEDTGYVEGQPPPPAGKEYLGVFLLIDNQSEEEFELPKESDFEITDTAGTKYEPIEAESAFAFPFGGIVEGDSQIPHPDSSAAGGPTQGALILFLVDDAVSENRPLELDIHSQGEEAVVELDI